MVTCEVDAGLALDADLLAADFELADFDAEAGALLEAADRALPRDFADVALLALVFAAAFFGAALLFVEPLRAAVLLDELRLLLEPDVRLLLAADFEVEDVALRVAAFALSAPAAFAWLVLVDFAVVRVVDFEFAFAAPVAFVLLVLELLDALALFFDAAPVLFFVDFDVCDVAIVSDPFN